MLVPGLAALGIFLVAGEVGVAAALVATVASWIGAVAWAAQRPVPASPVARPPVDTTIAAAILDALPDAVVLLNAKRHIMAANQAASEIMGERRLRGRDLSQTLRHPQALEAVNRVLAGEHDQEVVTITLPPAPIQRSIEVHVAILEMNGQTSPRILMTMRDVTPVDAKDARDTGEEEA